MIRILLILTSVSLRYFKADWEESEYMLIKKKIDLWLKKEIQNIFLWLRMSFCKEEQRDEIWMLIYAIILRDLEGHDSNLEKVSQFGW